MVEVNHAQDLPGAEHPDEAWTTTAEFGPQDIFLEMGFVAALMKLPPDERIYPDDPTKYTIKGRRSEQDIRDLATGSVGANVISGQTTTRRPTERVKTSPNYL